MRKSQLLLPRSLSSRFQLPRHLNQCLKYLQPQLSLLSLSNRHLFKRPRRMKKMRRFQQLLPPHLYQKLSKLKKRKKLQHLQRLSLSLLIRVMMMITNLEMQAPQTSLMMNPAQNYYYAKLIML